MFDMFKRDKIEKMHTVKLIHKRVKNMGSGNQSYKGYMFVFEINNEARCIDIHSDNIFNHYNIGEYIQVLEIQKLDSNKEVSSIKYSVKEPLKGRKDSIKNACKNGYTVYVKTADGSNINLEEVKLVGEWPYCRYNIYKKDNLDMALVNTYNLYECENFKYYDLDFIKKNSLVFNEYLSGFDVEMDINERKLILTIKDTSMIYFVNSK